MHFASVNKVHLNHDNEKEVEVRQSLAILEYLVLNREAGRILRNQNVLIPHEQAASEIEEANKMEELLRAIGQKVPKSENGGNHC